MNSHPLFDTKSFTRWFLESKRDLPWRNNPTSYQVWISEVMLQQTRASVVIPYYERWMERFPALQHLANASLDEVIKLWEGLGYYSRARSLHEGAKFIVEKFQGVIPDTYEDLARIKGVGDYTIGAILSFAFHQRVPAVDGNVMRVLSRYFAIRDDIAKMKTRKLIRELEAKILPEEESWLVTEGLIELGATVCTRKPQCGECPLQKNCQAYRQGIVSELPYKSTKAVGENLYRLVAVIKYRDKWLVRRGEKGKVMADLYEFPWFETIQEGWSEDFLTQSLRNEFLLPLSKGISLEKEVHSYTRYTVQLNPFLYESPAEVPVAGYDWTTTQELTQKAFSSGHRRIWDRIRALQSDKPFVFTQT
jgi:A/G-specific adenine glycosylase